MKLSDYRKKYKHHINYGLSMGSIGEIRRYYDFDFEVFLPSLDCNLQRELCWTDCQKSAFIEAVLKEQAVPPITVIQVKEIVGDFKNNPLLEVIDGKQRMTTLFDFIDGKITIQLQGQPYYFQHLPEDCQRAIKGYNFTYNVHYSYGHAPISDETKIDLFEQVNFMGTPQDIEHFQKIKNKK